MTTQLKIQFLNGLIAALCAVIGFEIGMYSVKPIIQIRYIQVIPSDVENYDPKIRETMKL